MSDDLDDLGIAVAGVTDLGDLSGSDGTASQRPAPGRIRLQRPPSDVRTCRSGSAAISLSSSLANLVPVKVWAERPVVTAVGFSHASAMRSRVADGSLPLPSAPWSDVKLSMRRGCWKPAGRCLGRIRSASGWFEDRTGGFGSLFDGYGVGMRDIVFSFSVERDVALFEIEYDPVGQLAEDRKGTRDCYLDAAIELLDSELQATVLLCRNGAAEEHFIGVDLRRGLLDVATAPLTSLSGTCRSFLPDSLNRLETTRFGKFQKSA